MHPSSLLAAAALAAALVFGCTPPEERAERARDTVGQALARGERAQALEAIEQLRESLPATPDALLEVAELLVQAGSAPDAGWLLEAGVRRYPERHDLRVALARVALLLGNPTLAREAVAPVAPGSEHHAAALVVGAVAELNLGDVEGALAALAEAERLYPKRPEASLARIATLLSERRQEEARAAIEEARAALTGEAAEQAEIRRRLDVTLAQIQAARGEPEAAITTLEGMVRVNPAHLLAWRALVQLLAQQGRSDEALALLESVLDDEQAPVYLFALAAEAHSSRGQDEQAEAALRSFVARSESAAAYLPLVNFFSVRDDAEATTRVLEEAIARFPDAPTLHLLHTEALLAQKRIDHARGAFRSFRDATFDGDPQKEYLRARIELAEGDARAAAERLTKLAPRLDRASTQFWLGRALEQSGDSEGALRRYGLAQRRDRNWPAPAAARIALMQTRGDWHGVAAEARLLLRHTPDQLAGRVALGEALAKLGEFRAAEEVARKSLERFPDRAEPHVLLAKVQRAQRRYDEALEALAAAQAKDGAATLVAKERVLTLGMAGQVEAGIALARDVLARQPDSAGLHAALASLLFAAGVAEEGAQATDRALALDRDEPRPLRVRCEFRAGTARWPGARDDCTRYLEARPDDASTHFMLGVVHQRMGDATKAAASYRRAAELDLRDARPRNNLAELLAAAGDLDGALQVAQDAYRLAEANPYVMDTLGVLYLRKGLLDRSILLLERAHTAAPDLPGAALHLGLAYREAGRTEDARQILAELRRGDAGGEVLQNQVEEVLHSLP